MKRRNLFQKILVGGTLMTLLLFALNSCSKDKDVEAEDKIFTIDLTDPKYDALKTVGGTVIVQVGAEQILVCYRGSEYELYFAVSGQCTYDNCLVAYTSIGLTCPCCGSQFDEYGVKKGPATVRLKSYTLKVNKSILTIWLQ